jgi:PAS domain S-box-containing protein
MSNPSFRVLLVGDQPKCLQLLRRQQFKVACAKRLAGGLAGLRSRHVGLVLMTLIAAGTLQAADPAFPEQTLQTVTNISQLYRLSESGQRAIYSIRLEGMVCAANPANGGLILRDDSGAVYVGMDLKGQSVQPGQQIVLEGSGMMEKATLIFGKKVPLVDNDGTHEMFERSGMMFLKAGKHPIDLLWFNAAAERGLEVYYSGPDLPRQKIPDSALFHTQAGPAGTNTHFVNGLNYSYYESGMTNGVLPPDFSGFTAVKTGTVPNFDINVTSRSDDVALEFTGYVELAREGLYTFSTVSDDGSRLFVGEAQARLDVIGSAPPPVPRPIIISQALPAEEEHQWSEVEGTVTFVSEQPNGCELELSSGTGRMRVNVAEDSGDAPIFLLNSQVRVKGISRSTRTSEGQEVAGAMFVAGWKQIELLQLAAEYWTAYPLVPIGSLLTNKLAWTNEAIVRVQGKFRSAAPDGRWMVEDDTGQMPLEGLQALPKPTGDRLELLGKLSREGTHVVMRGAAFREVFAGTNVEALPVLTSAKQIQYLSREEAKRAYPVKIRGVVISTITWRQSFIIQDATHGIFVRGIPEASPPHLGDFFEVEGVTAPGDFAPTVLATHVVCLGAGLMPEPLHPNRDQIINGSLDAQYVELQGIVTTTEPSALTLLTLDGKYRVDLVDALSQNLTQFENALVRIKGCFITSWDSQTKQIRIGQIRIFFGSISVDEPAPADLFSAPLKSVQDLLLFDAKASALKRVKVTGQIVHERAGEYFMMNGTNGLRLFLKTPVPLQTGDLVEAVGFPMLGNASPVLHDAVVRQTGKASLPEARRLAEDTLFNSDFDATVVRVESKLVGMRSVPSGQELELQTGTRTFVARLDSAKSRVQPIPAGSWLQLTGVYAGRGGDRSVGRDIDSFELLLNSPADVKVLKHPSWWTIGHTLVVVGVLVGVLLLAFAWISSLHRQVNLKTRQLQDEIEERKQAEEALRQSHDELEKRVAERTAEVAQERRLLRTLVDNLPDGIYAKDTAGRKIMVNPADLKVLGCRTEAEAIGKSDFDFFPKDMAEQFWADDQKVIRGEPVINREEFVLDEQGRKCWLLTSKLPLRDQAGKIIGLVGIGRNITERKQAEEALRQSHDELEKRVTERTAELAGANAILQQQIAERKRIELVLDRERLLLRTLVDNLPDAIYAKDTAGRKTMANPADLKNLRCQTEAEAIGKNDFDLFPKEIAEKFWADDQKVIQGEPVINREEHFFDEAGQKRWLLTSKLPLRDPTGKIVGLVGIGHDITERKRVEQALAERTEEVSQRNQELAGANATLQQQIAVRERIEKILEGERNLLRTLIDSLPDYVYAKDAEGRFTIANTGVARQLGFASPNEVIGKSDFDLFPHELAARYRADEQEILRSGKGLYSHEGPTVDASQQEKNRWVSTTKVPLRNDLGEIIGFVGLGHDITERKRMEEALQKSSRELQERNDELARFTYTASHDLKSPLVTVKAFLGYLEQDTSNQDAQAIKKDRQYIYTAVDKMTRLLDELLDLTRVGHKMNPPEEVPLQVVVKDALDLVAGWIIQKGVEVVVTKEPIMLCGDRTRLVEVFQNLVDNAIKFMGDQPAPRVEIGVEKAGEENVFFVRDNGIGIDPRYQPKVFGLFEKYDPGTRGTGIGLALVKRIVEVHGGKIWVESAGIGKGTTFRFTLAKTQPHPAQP